jgi:hypothetical protein
MFPTPMLQQSIIGIFGPPSKAVRFFKRPPKLFSGQSSHHPLCHRVEPDRALVGSEQLCARSAGHPLAFNTARRFPRSFGALGHDVGNNGGHFHQCDSPPGAEHGNVRRHGCRGRGRPPLTVSAVFPWPVAAI